VFETANIDRRSRRRDATRREILDAAWALVRAEGLAALSVRDLARRVGMQAPSLYAYFPSKAAIYDAMFLEGYLALLDRIDEHEDRDLTSAALAFAAFCTEDTARYQLLFQRTVPGFEPSAAAYAPALEVLERTRQLLGAAGIDGDAALDVWTALLTGLVDQQLSNDPGGDRWVRLIPDATQMFLHHFGGTR
jgi:AcrR family transcriptional regulator